MTHITTVLRAAKDGDSSAADQVYAALYHDLRRLARNRLRQSGGALTLQTTALVHESYLRLQKVAGLDFADRVRCLAYVSRVMRAVVVDLIRAQAAQRRGGNAPHLVLDTGMAQDLPQHDRDILRVHEALEELAAAEPRLAQIVEMRYFGGLSETDIAQALAVTERTVQRDWQKARLFLAAALA